MLGAYPIDAAKSPLHLMSLQRYCHYCLDNGHVSLEIKIIILVIIILSGSLGCSMSAGVVQLLQVLSKLLDVTVLFRLPFGEAREARLVDNK